MSELEWLLIGGFVLYAIGHLTYIYMQEADNPTYDRADARTVSKSELETTTALAREADQFETIVYGQAGKVKSHQVFGTRSESVKRALRAFSRDGFDEVRLSYDKADKLVINRMMHSHRGRKEGNVVGMVEVYAINPAMSSVRKVDEGIQIDVEEFERSEFIEVPEERSENLFATVKSNGQIQLENGSSLVFRASKNRVDLVMKNGDLMGYIDDTGRKFFAKEHFEVATTG